MRTVDRLLAKLADRGPRPPVSAVISASNADSTHLAATLRHLFAHPGLGFAERVVVVAPPLTAALQGILDEATSAGTIDRVVVQPASRAEDRAIHDRYFEPGTDRDDEGAIYRELAAIEAARHDLVAWFRADVLVRAPDAAWYTRAVDALVHDPARWLATTRGGPPPGVWRSPRRHLHERVRGAGRAAGASLANHFVCDRRRLVGRLRWVPGATRDLSHCLVAALARHAARGDLVGGAWHLRPRSHAPPWPQWVEQVAAAVERGEVPVHQADGWLRLDEPKPRSAWRAALFTDPRVAARPRPTATVVERRATPGTAPVSVVIPIRNRAGTDVRNALASLAWQQGGAPWEIILVSHGSDPPVDAELRALAQTAGATLITVGSPADPWCKPLALNTGILATDPSIPLVMTMDGDMVLAESFLATALAEVQRDPDAIVLCQSSDLPETCTLPAEPSEIRARFESLRRLANVRGTFGTGGIQLMRRSFLFQVRGYDEDMLWWGALDTDLVQRAEAAGLRVAWITARTAMLHQWHPRKHDALREAAHVEAAQGAWLRNHELMLDRAHEIVRNPHGWGARFTAEGAPRGSRG